MFCTQILIINQNKYQTLYLQLFYKLRDIMYAVTSPSNINFAITMYYVIYIINTIVDILTSFVSNFSQFKDSLDLEYKILYFSIMEKTHIKIETNIMGKRCVLYMQPYDNLPPMITATAPCCLSCGGLSRRSPRPFACCPP